MILANSGGMAGGDHHPQNNMPGLQDAAGIVGSPIIRDENTTASDDRRRSQMKATFAANGGIDGAVDN